MTSEQAVWTWEEVKALPVGEPTAWVISPLFDWAVSELPYPVVNDDSIPEVGLRRLVVIGGGAHIDRAKFWRREHSAATWLCAIPSLWGSGADASSVAVRVEAGQKKAYMAPELRPDVRAICPALADRVPAEAARWGYGDTFAHSIESFFSPLANDALRIRMSAFLCEQLLPQPLVPDPAWFELSAQACALQAQAGVGLVHGIAHVLEPESIGFGHARICAAFLFPVLTYDISRGSKFSFLCESYHVDLNRLVDRAREIFAAEDFEVLMPALEKHWASVLRHPFSRINCAIVRPDALSYFQNQDFLP